MMRSGEPVPETRTRLGDYALWFQRVVGERLGVVDVRVEEEELPEEAAGFIVMGSPLSVLDPHPWLPRAVSWARRLLAQPKPVLGVCFGHQLFAVAQGGTVGRNTRLEVGTIDVAFGSAAADDPLFAPFVGGGRFNSSHEDTITELPEGAQVLGTSERDVHQVLRWGAAHWSVQFHPEMRGEEVGYATRWRAPRLREEGEDPAEVAVEDTPDGVRLLERFVGLVREREREGV